MDTVKATRSCIRSNPPLGGGCEERFDMFRAFNVSIRVDIPALSDLVAYLRESLANQAQIDALTGEVTSLTSRLQKSNTGLEAATTQET